MTAKRWFAAPVYVHCCTSAPAAALDAATSSALPLFAFTMAIVPSPVSRTEKRWALVPLQDHCCAAAPSVRLLDGMSRHLPGCASSMT